MTNSIANMTSNVNIGINEVVSVFVSKYETNLFEKKDDLSAKIKAIKAEIEQQDKSLIGTVVKSDYEHSIAALNISSVVESVTVEWEPRNKKVPHINVYIKINDNDGNGSYGSSIGKSVTIDIVQSQVDLHKERTDRIESLNSELLEVMGLIKGVSRKERQIRGQISEMKLKESGFQDLLSNPDMMALVKLD